MEQRAGKSIVRGVARGVSWRKEGAEYPLDVLTFRVEQVDENGNIINYVPVTMKGLIKGSIADGDEVEVVGHVDDDGWLNAESIYNLKTHAYTKPQKSLLSTVFIIIFIVIFLSIIYGTYRFWIEWNEFKPPM